MLPIQQEGNRLSLWSKAVLVLGDHTHRWILFQPPHHQDTPGRRPKVDGAQSTVAGLQPLSLVHVPDEDHGAASALRHSRHPFQNGTYLIGPMHVHIVSQICLDGIQHNELCPSPANRLLQPLVAEGQLLLALVDDQHPGAVRTGGIQPWLDGVRQPVLRRLVDHIQRFQRFFILRQSLAPSQGGDHRQHEGGLALAGVTLDNGQLPSRKVRIPEPFHLLCFDLVHGDELQIRRHFLHILSCMFSKAIVSFPPFS